MTIRSELNISEHWTKKHKRKVQCKIFIRAYWKKNRPNITLPCMVKLTRVAPRKLDYDNLVGAFKCVRDCVADLIIPGLQMGRADNDERIKWEYGQESGKGGFKIEIQNENAEYMGKEISST